MASSDEHDQPRLPSLCERENLEDTLFFKEFKRTFEEDLVDDDGRRAIDNLEAIRRQLCLLCFAVFPENAEISRRLLRLWWNGEDIIVQKPKDHEEARKSTDETLKRFVELGIIEPVKKESRPDGYAKSFKISPLVRAALIKLAKDAKFFDFDDDGNPPITFSSNFSKACLGKLEKGSFIIKEARKLETLFNVSEPFPDLRISEESLAKMKNLGVLYLGRWGSTPKQHIEVENSKFLKAFKEMKKLRFLSLQGISKITKLPSFNAILSKLIILDLRACYSLEQLPTRWDYLKSLTYLDISECYLLEFMPRSLASLPDLQVLKGFVLSDKDKSCSLSDLAEGSSKEKLKKLSLVINDNGLMLKKLGQDWRKFRCLEKLKIAWVPKLSQGDKGGGIREKQDARDDIVNLHFLENLKKLDLECYPASELPEWMQPNVLTKLYIRGGNLKCLDEENAGKYRNVKILRFKYLRDFKINWMQLQTLFPNLEFLEKVKCPRITFCPCDGNGIWIKPVSGVEIE